MNFSNRNMTRKVWYSTAAGDEGGGGNAGTGAGTTSTASAGNTTEDKSAGSTEKMLPQSEVDRIVNNKADQKLRLLTGGVDITELKAKAARADELEAQQGSDLDKAVNAAKKEATTETANKYQGVLRSAAVQVQAARLGFRDAGDAVSQLTTSGVLAGIKVNDDGTVDTAAVERELKALAAAKSYLLVDTTEKKDPPPPPPGSAGIGATGDAKVDTSKTVTPGLGRLRSAYSESPTTHQHNK